MPFTPTVFNNGVAPGVSAQELNKLGTGVQTAQATADAAQTKANAAVPKSGASITDANVLTAEGFYNVGSTWTGSPFPSVNGGNQGYLQHYQWTSAAYALQVHTEVNATKLRRYRIKDNGVWQPWVDFITSAGGQTINGNFEAGGAFGFATGDKAGRRRINSDGTKFNFISDANDFANVAALEFYASSGVNKVWHRGELRDNAGVLEFLTGGIWKSLAGAKAIPLWRGGPLYTASTTYTPVVNVFDLNSIQTSLGSAALIWDSRFATDRTVYFRAFLGFASTSATVYVSLWNGGTMLAEVSLTPTGAGGDLVTSGSLSIPNGAFLYIQVKSSNGAKVICHSAELLIV